MTNMLLLGLLMMSSASDQLFNVQSNLQALYDEVDQATLQFESPADVDQYHAVRYANDWTFVDAKGTRHSWSDMRPAIVASIADRDDWLMDSIQKIESVKDDKATALVSEIVVKKATTETTKYRDTWVRAGDSWKFASREQVGASKTAPYNPNTD